MQSLIIVTAALPSLVSKESKQQGKARTPSVSSVCAVFQIHKTGILGTFKFITKCVVYRIIADLLKKP